MNLHLTGHHLEVTPALREYIQTKLARVSNHFDHMIDVKVTLTVEKLAQKVGLNPFHDYPTLKKNLLKEFSASTRNSRRNIMPTSMNSFVIDPNNPEHKQLMKIINDI